jgi:hypothetical protein
MKKLLPYILIFLCLAAGVGYFVYQYSPSTLEKKESQFAIKNIDDVTEVRLSDEKGQMVDLTKKDKKWILNNKYEVNEEALALLLMAIQKIEAVYPAPATAEPVIRKDMDKQRTKCEIYLHGEDKPAKVYYVGGPTADGGGTYMIMEANGHLARHPYVTRIPGVNAYLTNRYYPDLEHWRTMWVIRDNDQTIQSVSLDYVREKQKSLTITRVAGDSFVIAHSDGTIGEQPRQKFIHQYLEFYSALPIEQYENKSMPKDTILPTEPYCIVTLKRMDKTEDTVTVYYMPINEQSRVPFDEQGRKMLYDVEHYYILYNDKKDFAMIQYYTWGRIFRTYQDFFVKPGH